MKWLGLNSYEALMSCPEELVAEAIKMLNDIEDERIHAELRAL